MFRLDGEENKVAIVTGASRGLGQAMAIGLAEAGANIVAVSTDAGNLKETEAKVLASGCKVLPVKCDVSSPADIKNAISKTIEEFGTVDILVNNAGTIRRAPVRSILMKTGIRLSIQI